VNGREKLVPQAQWEGVCEQWRSQKFLIGEADFAIVVMFVWPVCLSIKT